MHRPLIDHRGPEFSAMMRRILEGLARVFGTGEGVLVFPSSATGCWEAALVNALSPGDAALVCENGFFAAKWASVASRLGVAVERLEGDWRRPVDPAALAARLSDDRDRRIRAVMVVHNETSTGVTSDIAAVRRAIDEAGHDALLMVDAVSSLGATGYAQDAWGVDVTVCGSQKGFMLPPGLAFCGVSASALEAARASASPRAYWDWDELRRSHASGFFPATPPTSLLFGLAEAIDMLEEEGLDAVVARHARLAEATRRAVTAWGLENYSVVPEAFSNAGTTVLVPEEVDADALRERVRERFGLTLGGGLGPLAGRVFRIGHLGDLDDLMLAGALCGIEMGLREVGVAPAASGVEAAMDALCVPGTSARAPAGVPA